MSCYKIPEGCCNEIESMLARFWWGSNARERKMHRLSWGRMGKAKNKGGLGFRGFSVFNKALLGKQCWRILSDNESLLSIVFKSRYFPRSDFMESKIGFQPSYAWRSLFNAKDVMELGSRWLIGDGQKVKIWKDNWLLEQGKFKVWSPVKNLPQDAPVSELIDRDTKNWNRTKVFNTFNLYEANQIINIPISWRLPEDKRIWHWERNGNYSVRSAYHAIQDENNRENPEASSMSDQRLWRAVWNMHVPNSTRNFLWRLARNILPTRGRLEQKGVNLDPICPLCFSETETTEHLFMRCPMVQQLWFISALGIHIPQHVSLAQWLQQWITSSDKVASHLFSITLWLIWKGRNQLIFNKTTFCPVSLANEISNFSAEFLIANTLKIKSVRVSELESWEQPNVGTTKINVDTGCFQNGTTGWGYLARDHTGMVSFAATHLEKISISPLLAEAMALRWCLHQLL